MTTTKATAGRMLLVCAVASAALCAGCRGGESDSLVHKKLDVVVAADLKAIVSEMPTTSLSDSVYSRIADYSTYKKSLYSVRAVVDFYYLRGVQIKRTVKYRYLRSAGKWERYDNAYRFFSDSASR
jgi:hypothetical protein